MTDTNNSQLIPIRRALISVSNKEGIVELARTLKSFDVEIISTGGTATALREAGDRSSRCFRSYRLSGDDGRTRQDAASKNSWWALRLSRQPMHISAMNEHDIAPIDMVVVNLYPFEETIAPRGRHSGGVNRADRYRRTRYDSFGSKELGQCCSRHVSR